MVRALSVFAVLLAACIPLAYNFYIKSSGLVPPSIYSSLQDGHPVVVDSNFPYPEGAELTLTCQSSSGGLVRWVDDKNDPNAFQQTSKRMGPINIRNLTIAKLTNEHDGLYLQCFEDGTANRAQLFLNILGTPKLSISFLEDQNAVQCKVLSKRRPELVLCISVEGESNCTNRDQLSLPLELDSKSRRFECKVAFKEGTDTSHLKNETIEMFQEMFEQSKESLVVATPGRYLQETASRLPSDEVVSTAKPGNGNGKFSAFEWTMIVMLSFIAVLVIAVFIFLKLKRSQPFERVSGNPQS